MNTLPTSASSGPPTPLPLRQFKSFMLFWHVFLLGGLAVTLVVAWPKAHDESGWRWVALATLVVIQATIYLKTFGNVHHSAVSGRWWVVYFTVSLGLWVAEVSLEPRFEWLIGAYVGQMLGAVSPRYSLPASAVILVSYFTWRIGWSNLSHLNGWMVLASGGALVSWMGLGVFLHKLAATSAERGRLIEELQAARKQLELARDREAELAVLRDRERLARDLHDSLGHALVTLSVQLEALPRLYAADPSRAPALVQEMKCLTRSSMDDLRRSLANLRAPGLGDQPLAATLRTLTAEIAQRAGLNISSQLDEAADRLPPRVVEALWRVSQEGLANVEKHARAQDASLRLRLLPGWVELKVEDNGLGLPEQPEQMPGHYGLRGLRERVEGLGGTFALAKADPSGTLLEARIPVLS